MTAAATAENRIALAAGYGYDGRPWRTKRDRRNGSFRPGGSDGQIGAWMYAVF